VRANSSSAKFIQLLARQSFPLGLKRSKAYFSATLVVDFMIEMLMAWHVNSRWDRIRGCRGGAFTPKVYGNVAIV